MPKFFGARERPNPGTERGGGATTAVDSDLIVRFSSIVNSSLSTRTGAVQLSVVGIAGMDYEAGTSDPSDATAAENTDNAPQYSAPGIIGRPLAAQSVNGSNLQMDVVSIVTADGLVPIGYRDLRLKMGGGGPAAGVLAFVGYGGGFVSHTPVPLGGDPAGGGTVTTFYCPYDFDAAGNAQKAHTLIMDPTPGNESVMIIHSSGLAISMFGGALLMKNAAGDATFRLDENGIVMTGTQIVLSGGVIVGDPATAVPLLAGPASPGSTKFYVSP